TSLIMVMLLKVRVPRLRLFFFFSSRRRHTRSKRDWSSDVCSSDLCPSWGWMENGNSWYGSLGQARFFIQPQEGQLTLQLWKGPRSEERRVGKECRSRWGEEQENKKPEI